MLAVENLLVASLFACAGHGDCAVVAPSVFRVDEIAEVIGDGPADQILEAARTCPAAAITVVDADSEDQVYP
jgi:ferredoxin